MAAEVQNQMNNKPLLKENKSSPKYNESMSRFLNEHIKIE